MQGTTTTRRPKLRHVRVSGPDLEPDAELRHASVSVRRLDSLRPSPENDLIYRPRTMADPDFRRLVESMRERGLDTPLLISLDNFIISGHQRYRAAKIIGMAKVQVIALKLRRSDHTPDAWTALLREYNTGREKTFDELVREKLIDIDPDEAINAIVDDEIERTTARVGTIDFAETKIKRYGIADEKLEMVQAIVDVLDDLAGYLPVSLRAIHYRLLTRDFWRNTKDRTRYVNDRNCYGDLSRVATRLRINGVVPFDSICDETRPLTTWAVWRSAADFIAEKSEQFLRGFARDLLQSQPTHFEIVVEKLTVQNFVHTVAMKYRMPVVVMRGNSGIDARYQIVQRLKASGKRRLFLFCLGDCDPDGDNICLTTLSSLRDDFGLSDVQGVRVAMTHDQADELSLPSDLEAKASSSNYRKFVARHGRKDCYELDAVEPTVLQGWLDAAIRGIIDIEAFNHEVAKQTAEAQEILARRKVVLELMRDACD